jgi:predicted deacylase
MARSISRVTLPARGQELTVVTLTPNEARPPGRTVAICANVHGDECTGLGAVLKLVSLLDRSPLRGTVHLYPTLNPQGLERRTRKVPEDDQDLNRLFPGDPEGAPSERLAYAIWTDLCARRPDCLIDLHADSTGALPYALLDRATSLRGGARSALEASTRALADAAGLTVLHEYPEERYARFRLDRSLSGAVLNRLQIPAVTLEAGPRLTLDAEAVDMVVDAVTRMLAHLGLVDPRDGAHPTRVDGGPWRRDSGPRASTSGVLVPVARPGTLLARGDLVAEVRALSGGLLEELTAEAHGFVVSHAERSHVVAGVPVCTYALREEA